MDLVTLIAALALVFLNGFFVAAEFALVKVRPSKIEELIDNQRPGARAVKDVVANLEGYVSATQLGVTFSSLGLGWLGGPSFTAGLRPVLESLGILQSDSVAAIGFLLAFTTIAFLHVVLGELAPKSLALIKPEAVALVVVFPLRAFYILLSPAIWGINGFSSFLLRRAGLQLISQDEAHSEEDLKLMLSRAQTTGELTGPRAEMLQKAFVLPNKSARHLMVPRNEVVFLDINQSVEENIERAMLTTHSRFPLCDRELDNTLGVISLRDLLYYARENAELDLRDLSVPVTFFPETMPGDRLLTEFPARKISMAIIVDEYGGASGIVTAKDIVTEVMGELEEDSHDLVLSPGGFYDVEGVEEIEDVENELSVTLPSAEGMTTIGGFMMEQLGRMPRPGDSVTIENLVFRILEMTGPRVMKVRIRRNAGIATATAPESATPARPVSQ